MTAQIFSILVLTFVIHIVSTLAYSVRIVGVRTGRIAVSFALFNILVLVSRTANTFQAPLLAKHVETGIATGNLADTLSPFRWVLLTATLDTLVGAILIPSFQRLFTRAVVAFKVHRSVPRLLLHSFSKTGIRHVRHSLAIPSPANISSLSAFKVPPRILFANVFAVALLSVGVLSALYAGYLDPQLRATSITLSGIINGVATIILFVFIDPYLSMLTDDVLAGEMREPAFRQAVIQMVGARAVGTVAGQLLLFPAAYVVVVIARAL